MLRRALKIFYSNTVTPGNFLSLIQNAFHYYEKFKRRKKSQKKKKKQFTNRILYIFSNNIFCNNISNHNFYQKYTGHRFPHQSPKCWCLYLGLNLVNCPGKIILLLIDFFKGMRSWTLALIFRHIFSIHTQADSLFQNVDLNSFPNIFSYIFFLIFSYAGIFRLMAAVMSEQIHSFSCF